MEWLVVVHPRPGRGESSQPQVPAATAAYPHQHLHLQSGTPGCPSLWQQPLLLAQVLWLPWGMKMAPVTLASALLTFAAASFLKKSPRVCFYGVDS